MLVMKVRVCGHGTTTCMLGSLDHLGTENTRKIRAKERAKKDQKKPERHSLVKNKHMNQNCGQKKMVFCGPEENEATKASASQEGNAGFRKGRFALAHLNSVQAVFLINTKARAKIKKEEAREVPIHRQDFQLLKIPLKRDKVTPGKQTIGRFLWFSLQRHYCVV